MHVAVVSFGYPPIPHVSGTRAEGMAVHLTGLGHAVTVLTVDWREATVDRPKEVVERGVHVVRIDPRPWYPEFDPRRPPFTTERHMPNGIARRLRTVRTTLAWGSHARWAEDALMALRTVHAVRPLDVVWAIHGDDSSHEVAARFHRDTGVPWVADFKDPWNVFHSRPMWPLQWAATWRRLRGATAITETSEAQARLDGHFRRPWHVVWSGYDDAAMRDAEPVRVSQGFTLGYFGNAAVQHDVPRLARALAASAAGERLPFELHVFGGYDAARWRPALEEVGLLPRLRVHEMLPREQAFARMKGVDVLLLLPMTNYGRSRIAIGVKELEYLASGTPVLSMGKILPELRSALGATGQMVEAETEGDAAAFLHEEYEAFDAHTRSSRRASVNAPAVARYSWRAQAELLGTILEAAARRRG
jgi:glycosyltransferase involved in cell wall biosynthesis